MIPSLKIPYAKGLQFKNRFFLFLILNNSDFLYNKNWYILLDLGGVKLLYKLCEMIINLSYNVKFY